MGIGIDRCVVGEKSAHNKPVGTPDGSFQWRRKENCVPSLKHLLPMHCSNGALSTSMCDGSTAKSGCKYEYAKRRPDA
jgi:hypothetical protein